MSKREPGILLDDIRTPISKIERYTTGLDERSFLADDKTIDAVVRNLEIIGEADACRIQETTCDDPVVANRRTAQPHCA